MKYIRLSAIVISCGFFVQAGAQEIGRYDKTIEKAAAMKAAEKMGSLRGLILADDKNIFVTIQDLQPEPEKKSTLYPAPYRRAWEPEPGMKPLPPMVRANQVDPFVTGTVTKFNSNGDAMPHHQDYSRPTPASVAKSLLKAMSTNPYPDGE